nr:ABC transporter substrate-binding protein [Kiloniella laminariae]
MLTTEKASPSSPWLGDFCKLFTSLAVFVFVVFSITRVTAEPVKVQIGITHFPPFYVVNDGIPHSGLGIDLITAMNDIQSGYHFSTVETSARRRHLMFQKGDYDVSLFDHLEWGWDSTQVEATRQYLQGGERYITLAGSDITPAYFEDLTGKKIGAILGYHYKFTNYETDPAALDQKFNISLVTRQMQILKMVLSKRVEIGVMTESFLEYYFQSHQDMRSVLLISEHYDQRYSFVGIARRKGPISAAKLEEILFSLFRDERYSWIAEKYGVKWEKP